MKKILAYTIILFISLFSYSSASFAHKGYGEVSKKTGKVKTERVRGHVKKSTGKYVDRYARSKRK